MGLSRRDKIARTLLIWTAIAAVALVLAGCVRVVGGRALMAGPKLGQPVQWTPCRSASGSVKIPGGALCGKLAVPVDYDHPGGDVAALAMIRFPATGDKIGSLVINPGGPGESGIEAALGVVQTLPKRVRERFDLVGFDPRGVGSSRPAVWCNSDADNDRLRTEPNVDYSPAGVAHIEDETKQFVGRCVGKMGKNFLREYRNRQRRQGSGCHSRGAGRRQADLPRLLVRHPDRLRLRRGLPAERAGDDPRRRRRPQRRSRSRRTCGRPRDSRTRSTTTPPTAPRSRPARWAPTRPKPSTSTTAWSTRWSTRTTRWSAGRCHTNDPRGLSYSDAIVGTIMALYSPTLWHHLTDGLSELVDHHGDTLLALADMYMRRDSHGHYTNATDARVAINCVDQPPITDRAKVIDEDRRSREIAPFMSYGTVHR